jgi:BarA-like signal transduction histidine kinase
VLNDTPLDKPYAPQMERVTYPWSGKHQRVVRGMALLTYHWAWKPCCGVERAQVRKAVAMVRHVLLALRAFLRLEVYRLRTWGVGMRRNGLSFGKR